MQARQHRRLPIGADVLPSGGVHFRVWASRGQHVEVVLEGGPGHHPEAEPIAVTLEPEGDGYFSYRLDGGAESYPDAASRFQPYGPHGPSQVIDPGAFQWHDQSWRGVPLEGQVIYEMHLRTFTPAGTWEAASGELPALAELGVTVLEIMPIADFLGRFGWGYDGVDVFAPTRLYGTPDNCRRFIDQAHALGLGVILDVVYNHLGPDGSFLAKFSPEYFTDRYTTDWGQAINYEDEHAGPVREFFIANAGYWIEGFHFNGLRLDATQDIYDTPTDHILAAIARRVRYAPRGHATLLVAENEPQHTKLIAEMYALHRDLLRLRKTEPVFRSQHLGGMDGAVLGPEAFVLRFFGAHGDDRLLVVNLGRDLHLNPAPEPLLAPPEGMDWEILWSSEDPRYGGDGVIPLEDEDNWHLPGHTAAVLRPHTRQGQEG